MLPASTFRPVGGVLRSLISKITKNGFTCVLYKRPADPMTAAALVCSSFRSASDHNGQHNIFQNQY